MKKIIRTKNGVKYTNKAGFQILKAKAKEDNQKAYLEDLAKGERKTKRLFLK